jgi:hypothetical protein
MESLILAPITKREHSGVIDSLHEPSRTEIIDRKIDGIIESIDQD